MHAPVLILKIGKSPKKKRIIMIPLEHEVLFKTCKKIYIYIWVIPGRKGHQPKPVFNSKNGISK